MDFSHLIGRRVHVNTKTGIITFLPEEENRMSVNKKRVVKRARVIARSSRSNPYPWMNRFYIGSQGIADEIRDGHNSEHTRPTLKLAVEDAKDKMEEDHGLELVMIVKIVKVIRRATPPIEEVDIP